MAYYVIRVVPRQEETFVRTALKVLKSEAVELLFPRRKMEHMKGGKRLQVEVALFPGYVFLRTDDTLSAELYEKVKGVPRFAHFVKSGDQVSEVRGKDLELLSHFLRFGEVTPKSQVVFDENQRIHVVSGPMAGFEGQIVHVDRRKRRAKVRLDFDHGTFTVTLGFELLSEPVEGTA